jgi:uncharacterized protein
MMNRMAVERRTIAIGLAGSHGYGLSRPESDLDYRGIFIATKPYYFGFKTIEQLDTGWSTESGIFSWLDCEKDTVIYELKKILSLLSGANPNIIELLWLNEYKFMTPTGQYLLDRRRMFLTKKVKHTYAGYALAQIKRIESHRKWLLDPPQIEPTREQFGLDRDRPISKDELHAFLDYLYKLIRGKLEYLAEAEELYQLLVNKIDFKGMLKQHPLSDEVLEYTQSFTNSRGDFIKLLQKNQQYQTAMREWKAYQSWKTNRNPTRAGMEQKSGYDLKHAMHCIRLLRSGIEILRSGEVCVDRRIAGDADELKAILNGDFTYSQISHLADESFALLDRVYAESTLPELPDFDAIDSLCIELVEMFGFS